MAFTYPLAQRNRGATPEGRNDDYAFERDFGGDYRKAFGGYIKRMRYARPEALGGAITQEELAAQLGVAHSTVSAIEVGRNSLSPERIDDMARILGVDLMEFTKVYLRWTNPWVYKNLIDGKDHRLLADLASLPSRVGMDMFKGPRGKSKRP